MPYAEIESSVEHGRPLAFYQFTFGTTIWRYTTADEDITIDGNVWYAKPINDDGVRQTGEVNNDAVTINGPASIGPGQLFMSSAPSKVVMVMIFDKHDQTPDLIVRYVGEISQVNYPMPGSCRITCENLGSTMRRQGLRLCWQRSCPYMLYDPVTCKVNKALWAYPFTVLAVNGFGIVIEVGGTPGAALDAGGSGYLDNGFYEWDHPFRGVELIAINAHSAYGSNRHALSLLSDPGEVYVGATGIAYRGCSFTPESCQSFGNFENYGGVPDLPERSIFDGNPVF